jgi:hypothetical protein
MGRKVPIAVMFEVFLHVLDCVTRGWVRGPEDPCALRASPALKVRTFDPYEFTKHAQSISRPLKKGDNTRFH